MRVRFVVFRVLFERFTFVLRAFEPTRFTLRVVVDVVVFQPVPLLQVFEALFHVFQSWSKPSKCVINVRNAWTALTEFVFRLQSAVRIVRNERESWRIWAGVSLDL